MFILLISSLLLFSWITASRSETSGLCVDNAPGRFCYSRFPALKIREYGLVPNEEQLAELCPKILTYFNCLKSYVEITCPNHTEIIELTVATHDVARELCSARSRLHKGYIRNVPCYMSIQEQGIASQCSYTAEILYKRYLLDTNEDYNVIEDSDRSRHKYCFEEVYKMACVSLSIVDECGADAQDTFEEIIDRSKALRRVCTPAFIDELQTDFIDFLDDEEERNHLSAFLNF